MRKKKLLNPAARFAIRWLVLLFSILLTNHAPLPPLFNILFFVYALLGLTSLLQRPHLGALFVFFDAGVIFFLTKQIGTGYNVLFFVPLFGLLIERYEEQEDALESIWRKSESRFKEQINTGYNQLVTQKEDTDKKFYDRIRQQAVLFEIIGHITQTLDMEEILDLTVSRTKQELRAEGCFLMFADGEMLKVRHSDGITYIAAEAFQSKLGEHPFGKIPLTGEPLLIQADKKDHPILQSLLSIKSTDRIKDVLAVPLKSPSHALPARGVLAVTNSLEEGGFSANHLEMLTILAGQAAIALDNAEAVSKQKEFFKETLGALAAAINQKHEYTHVLHSKSVAKWAVDLARKFSLPPEEIEKIEIAAILHDIGKIAIPDGILMKSGLLTPDEKEVMNLHPEKAANILKGVSFLKEIVPLIEAHHEWWDGKGYPKKLKGDAIPFGARVVAVADTFDAITSNRPYQKGLSRDEALTVIEKAAGTQFDPEVSKVFVSMLRSR